MSSDPIITDNVAIFLVIICTVAGTIWLSSLSALSKMFSVLPVVLWIVTFAALLSGFNVLPKDTPVYTTLGQICLPLSLFYLIASCDLSDLTKLGKNAVIAVLGGTLGVVIGGIVVVFLFGRGDTADLWQGFAIISAGWIGGTANGLAVLQGLGASADTLAPLLLMQTLVGIMWLMVILFFAKRQHWLQKLIGDPGKSEAALASASENNANPLADLTLAKFSLLVFLGFLALMLSGAAAGALPEIGDPVILSYSTWVIVLICVMAMVASFLPAAKELTTHSNNLGYFLLYIMLASLGAQIDFSAFASIGQYALAGICWLLIHFIVLLLVARLAKLPPAFVALGSMANIGGIVSTPLTASYYDKRLIPAALLMAVTTQIIGIYIPFALAGIFATIAGL